VAVGKPRCGVALPFQWVNSWTGLEAGFQRMGTQADSARLDDDEAANKIRTFLRDEVIDRLGQFLAGRGWKAEQDNSAGNEGMRKDELTEVLVLSQQNPAVSRSNVDDCRIVYTGRDFGNGGNIMPRCTKGADY